MDLDEIICDILVDQMAGIKSAIYTARQSGMTLGEVCAMADNADTPDAFIDALMMYAGAMPDGEFRVV